MAVSNRLHEWHWFLSHHDRVMFSRRRPSHSRIVSLPDDPPSDVLPDR
jgi:hypothetical protein